MRLIDATFQTTVSAGGKFTFSAHLSNDGYASVIKTRPLYLVFVNGSDRYNVKLSKVDVRTWVSGDVTLDQQTATLPSGMPKNTTVKNNFTKYTETSVIAAQAAIYDSGYLDLRLRGDDEIGVFYRINH